MNVGDVEENDDESSNYFKGDEACFEPCDVDNEGVNTLNQHNTRDESGFLILKSYGLAVHGDSVAEGSREHQLPLMEVVA